MKSNTEYIYTFPNASSTLRVVEYLRNKCQPYLDSVAVINQIDCWLIQVWLKEFTPIDSAKNIKAFFSEMGVPSQPATKIVNALTCLQLGESPTAVMNRYQVVIVAHGKPVTEEIEIFRDQIVDRLGYCPHNMA
ncbi:MAG: hypothetical protein AAF383_27145 [Cyanobacteria bacterium P01_A01_bin.83]